MGGDRSLLAVTEDAQACGKDLRSFSTTDGDVVFCGGGGRV
jgi:hypothetical protein